VNGAGVGGSSMDADAKPAETTATGTLNVTGGVLNANGDTNGGTSGSGYSGAGIGGSGARNANLTVTVSGGEVNAQGGPGAAGIGGGNAWSSGPVIAGNFADSGCLGNLSGTITVNGGSLTATAGVVGLGGAYSWDYSYAAGIGSSYTSSNNRPGYHNMSITVNGGTLVAKGCNPGTDGGSAGIGGYYRVQGSLCVNGGVVRIENGDLSTRSQFPYIEAFICYHLSRS
jgi:hypothetical protein